MSLSGEDAKRILRMDLAALKAELKQKSCAVSGSKSDLQDRLIDALCGTATSTAKPAAAAKKRKVEPEPAEEAETVKKVAKKETKEAKPASSSSSSSGLYTPLASYLTESSWVSALKDELAGPTLERIEEFLDSEVAAGKTVYPPSYDVFAAFNATPFAQVKVVIIGQDPYFNPNQGHGLCFSVQKGVAVPPSLNRVYKELESCIPGFKTPKHGYLMEWANQGVLLLNATLTVLKGDPNSHAKCGWQKFTDSVIKEINEQLEGVVFLLWGGFAQKKGKIVDKKKHHVLEGAHPSPMAGAAWNGNKHFSLANDYLKSIGKTPVDWRITP